MLVEAPAGELPMRWTIELGQRRIDFCHDGRARCRCLIQQAGLRLRPAGLLGLRSAGTGYVRKGISPWIDQLVSNCQLTGQGLV